ncbi:MAG TPA: LD-carboxypeptidase [Iamia sp.]|jgi:muramoyltetrapeptide carboxypeptidase|nr:LD-carboxypeptidase [Iamia sp.]
MGGRAEGGDEAVRAPRVTVGDRVRLVSPASWPDQGGVDEQVALLEGWGLVPEVGEHALDRWGYQAGREEDRIADLDDAFRDPGVRAVITTRGGAGAYRIADRLDLDAVRADPKPLVGFSDITNLHLVLWEHARLASIHGGLAGARATASVRHLLMEPGPLVVARDPDAYTAAIGVPGRATGPLLGGNLREVAGAIGAGLPDLRGAIVFLEDVRQIGLGQVDRQLTHLRRAGSLDGIAGVALGLFTGFDDYEDRGWDLRDVLRDRLGDLGVPVLGGLPAGHGGVGADGGPDQVALALGATATLDTEAGTLTVGPCVR